MPHSNLKSRATEFNTGVGKCSCGQTIECALEREIAMKRRKAPQGPRLLRNSMHHRFSSNPPVAFKKIGVPKKATTMTE